MAANREAHWLIRCSCGKTLATTTRSGAFNGRRAISSTQLPTGQVVFGKWSEMLICNWVGVEILVDPFTLASQAEIRVRSTLLADIQFRYPLAFCASSDSGAQ
jgi:hypothetical protein